jgi:hypothetical protein
MGCQCLSVVDCQGVDPDLHADLVDPFTHRALPDACVVITVLLCKQSTRYCESPVPFNLRSAKNESMRCLCHMVPGAFGARVIASPPGALKSVPGSNGLQLMSTAAVAPATPRREAAVAATQVELQVALLTLPDSTPDEWHAAIRELKPAPLVAAGSSVSAIDCQRSASAEWGERAACGETPR